MPSLSLSPSARLHRFGSDLGARGSLTTPNPGNHTNDLAGVVKAQSTGVYAVLRAGQQVVLSFWHPPAIQLLAGQVGHLPHGLTATPLPSLLHQDEVTNAKSRPAQPLPDQDEIPVSRRRASAPTQDRLHGAAFHLPDFEGAQQNDNAEREPRRQGERQAAPPPRSRINPRHRRDCSLSWDCHINLIYQSSTGPFLSNRAVPCHASRSQAIECVRDRAPS